MLIVAPVADASRKAFEVSGPHLFVAFISAICAVLCVLIHYEAMSWASRALMRTTIPRRARVVGLILALLTAHVVEVWIFGIVFWILDAYPQLGEIQGSFDEGALDYVYFSVVTFSTLGFGDFVPTGPVTILCGTEALLGLSFIAWTASIAFLEMQRDWIEFQPPRGSRYEVRPREEGDEER